MNRDFNELLLAFNANGVDYLIVGSFNAENLDLNACIVIDDSRCKEQAF